ncbi:MAG: HD domain-containing protein [Campylobacterota bacterium]|nr:HD domain-containing protein [Campylobacterota bacterium]
MLKFKLKRFLKKDFFLSLFWKQNKWHNHGVFIHTLLVVYYVIKNKQYKMIPAAFLHDIGKPLCVYQDEDDKITGEYSFTNHEELSYQLIKDINSISNYTKDIVRYHYLIRGIENAKKKNQTGKYKRQKRIYDKLDKKLIEDLKLFMIYDDLAKK